MLRPPTILVWLMGVHYKLFCATLCTRSVLLVIHSLGYTPSRIQIRRFRPVCTPSQKKVFLAAFLVVIHQTILLIWQSHAFARLTTVHPCKKENWEFHFCGIVYVCICCCLYVFVVFVVCFQTRLHLCSAIREFWFVLISVAHHGK